jgi:hypothetical protein
LTANGQLRHLLALLVDHVRDQYANVCNKRKKVRLVEVIQRVVYGDPEEVMQLLGADSGGKINTALGG